MTRIINNQSGNHQEITNNQIKKHGFDLEERTLGFAKMIILLCKRLPQNLVNRELISQLIRASGSVGANYREANDALSKKDFLHRIKITRKEAKESQYWIELLGEANPEFKDELCPALNESMQLKKIFSSIIGKSL